MSNPATEMMILQCECNSFDCTERYSISLLSAAKTGQFVRIAHTCKYGPDPTDRLVEKCEGYSLYDDGDYSHALDYELIDDLERRCNEDKD